MSRIIMYTEKDRILKEIVEEENECRWKVNNICYNNRNVRTLGKVCLKCNEGEKEVGKRGEEINNYKENKE